MLSGSEENAFTNYLYGGVISRGLRRKIMSGRTLQEYDWRQYRLARLPEDDPRRQGLFMDSSRADPQHDWSNEVYRTDAQRIPASDIVQQRKNRLQREGIRVRCLVHMSYWDPVNPSLQIITRRVDEPNNAEWVNDAPAYDRNPYHITIGYIDKIVEQVPDWRMHLRRLIKRFDNKVIHCRVGWFSNNNNIFLDMRRDPIARDPDFQALHHPHRFRNGNGSQDYAHITQ